MKPVTSLLIGVSALLAVAGRPASALADVVVFESYGGLRPSDAAEQLAPLYEEFRALDYAAEPTVLTARVDARVSRSGDTLSDKELAQALDLVDRGYARWLAGDFAPAAKELSAALAMFRDRPATVVAQPRYRDAVFKALIGLSLASVRLGDADAATVAMAELVRSFPDREISRSEYGPEPRQLYMKVRADLEEQSLGALRVHPDDKTVVVFVNGRYAGVGAVTLRDLHPGRYRIFVRRGEDSGRVHEIDVAPDSEQVVSVTWAVDASLRAGTDYVGFEFADETARLGNEATFASSIARRIDASSVVVVGIRRYRGRRSIVGTVLDLDSGKSVRTGAIAIEPASPAAKDVRALARFLAGGRAAPGILVEGVPRHGDGEKVTSAPKWPWLVIGGGVVALAGGATLVAIDQSQIVDGDRQPEFRHARTGGLAVAAGGAVVTGVGIYLWWRERDHERRVVTAVVPSVGDSWGLALIGRF